MRTRRLSAACLGSVLVLLFGVSAAIAEEGLSAQEQMRQARAAWLAAGAPGQKDDPSAPAFGVDSSSVLNVHSYEFQGNFPYGDHIADNGSGYRYFTSTVDSDFMSAPVQLPSGVIIENVRISDCINGSGDIFLGLWDAGVGGAAATNLVFVNTIPGCGTDSENLNYLYTANQSHPLYLLMLWGPTVDGSTRFNNVAITYRRQVSPAPVTATFLDVPTSSTQFQFIEALVAAGVTAGCGGGNYCPGNPVTRGQMAVFIAKALGLHFPL